MFSKRNIRQIPHRGDHHTIFTPCERDSTAEVLALMHVRLCRVKAEIEGLQADMLEITQREYGKPKVKGKA